MTTQRQQVTPELRAWIIQQATAGQKPEAVLKAMLASGWQEHVAAEALEHTLRGFLEDHAKANGLPPPALVPEPLLAEGTNVIGRRSGARAVGRARATRRRLR